jgi:hypothetical protein
MSVGVFIFRNALLDLSGEAIGDARGIFKMLVQSEGRLRAAASQ